MEKRPLEERIHRFWFGNDVLNSTPVDKAQFWYAETSDARWLDDYGAELAYIEEHFLFLVKSAYNGSLTEWLEEPRPCLSLILLLDQFSPRLLHNQNYERRCQELAIRYCRDGIAQNFDKNLSPVERGFFYGPLIHAPTLTLRSVGLRLLEDLLEEVSYKENPYHHQRCHVMQFLHKAAVQKNKAEKKYLSAIA